MWRNIVAKKEKKRSLRTVIILATLFCVFISNGKVFPLMGVVAKMPHSQFFSQKTANSCVNVLKFDYLCGKV